MKSFNEFITERVLSIGLNPSHEKFREVHRQQIHDILHKSYAPIGGYSGLKSGSKEESDAIHSDISNLMIKATVRGGKVSSVSLYKDRFGRKGVGGGTDGTPQGKSDYMKSNKEDHEQKRSWAEVSGAPEHINRKIGMPTVPATHAAKLTGKSDITIEPGNTHYSRKIGDAVHRKTIMGHPKGLK